MMAGAARAHLESLLRARKLDVTLTTSPSRLVAPERVAATGVASLDEALGGGLRRGHLSEIVGARSTGRTTLLCSIFASAAARGEVVALVDTHDRFDPVSAAAAGVDLSRVLWIRLPTADAQRALKAMNLVLQAGGFGIVAFDLADVRGPALRQFPVTTWMRLSRTIEGSQTVALLVSAEHVARSPAGATIALEAVEPAARWTAGGDRARRLAGISIKHRVIGSWTGQAF
jgi:hypothetical protein